MKLVKLLESKNRCLNRFLDLSVKFLGEVTKGDFSNIENFHSDRDSIIKALDLYDRQATKLACEAQRDEAVQKNALIRKVNEILKRRDETIEQIMRHDAEIITMVETERKRVARELAATQKIGNNLSKFKSSWVGESGDEIDSKL